MFFLADIYLPWAKYEQIQSKTFDQIWETCQLNVLWKLSELFSEFYAAVCQFSWVLFRIFAVIHFWISVLEMATSFFSLPYHYHIQNVLVISSIYYNFFHWFNFFSNFFDIFRSAKEKNDGSCCKRLVSYSKSIKVSYYSIFLEI